MAFSLVLGCLLKYTITNLKRSNAQQQEMKEHLEDIVATGCYNAFFIIKYSSLTPITCTAKQWYNSDRLASYTRNKSYAFSDPWNAFNGHGPKFLSELTRKPPPVTRLNDYCSGTTTSHPREGPQSTKKKVLNFRHHRRELSKSVLKFLCSSSSKVTHVQS